IQGGAITLLADASLAGAVETLAVAGTAIASIDVKVNFLRPAQADGRDLIAHARVEHSGRTLAVANAELFDADGQRIAIATGSSMYLPGHPAALGEIELGERGG
ncbi:MAG: PaaI family thioesterase, partial [Solirubrobacterales bacterium]